ncbi:hypothetical protein Tco_1211097 [Tanacetum coccineum]
MALAFACHVGSKGLWQSHSYSLEAILRTVLHESSWVGGDIKSNRFFKLRLIISIAQEEEQIFLMSWSLVCTSRADSLKSLKMLECRALLTPMRDTEGEFVVFDDLAVADHADMATSGYDKSNFSVVALLTSSQKDSSSVQTCATVPVISS